VAVSLVLQDTTINKMDESNPFYDYMVKGWDFTMKYNSALLDASLKAFEIFLSTNKGTAQNIRKTIRASFDTTLRRNLNDDVLASSIADYIHSWARLCDLFGYSQFTAKFYDLFSYANMMLEPLRDNINRTPSEVIDMKGRFNLLHYKSEFSLEHKTPLLVVYSLINRHYIMDLLPDVSVIKNLQRQGFDIYATDWGTPTSCDKDLSLETYAEEYVENAVEKIKEITGSDKVSLFGYCWGGLFALIYTATHQENVKNLILHATPVDIDKDKTIIENWASHLDADNLTDVFGNIPGWLLNLAFLIRNPIEAMLKYPRYFSEPRSRDEITQFFAIETWLYDSTPIIGEVYREIIDQVYKNNLLIKNQMKVGSDIINLKNITIPLLDIVGSSDDLVPPSASTSIINTIGSKDKKLIEFPTGHVGLCVSTAAHEKLWPEVGEWIAQRS
jgi:class III poly(R)-hydroxyalkanoic acid synthase PhaC subunit